MTRIEKRLRRIAVPGLALLPFIRGHIRQEVNPDQGEASRSDRGGDQGDEGMGG